MPRTGSRRPTLRLSSYEKEIVERVRSGLIEDFHSAKREGEFQGSYKDWVKGYPLEDLVEYLNDYDREMHFGKGRTRITAIARALRRGYSRGIGAD